MKLRDLIERVDPELTTYHKTPDSVLLCSELVVAHSAWDRSFDQVTFRQRFQQLWIAPWYCTDSWVGLSVIKLDGEPIAIAFQEGRKCDEKLRWVSAEAAQKAREVLLSLTQEPSLHLAMTDLDEEMGEYYTVEFGDQILLPTPTTKPVVGGQPVELVSRGTWNTDTVVRFPDGDERKVPASEVGLPFWIK